MMWVGEWVELIAIMGIVLRGLECVGFCPKHTVSGHMDMSREVWCIWSVCGMV